jgi:hypothetical protein
MKLFSTKKKSSSSSSSKDNQGQSPINGQAPKNPSQAPDEDTEAEKKEETKSALSDILTEDDLLKIPLAQLNSKQRRLLRRKLKRDQEDGDTASDQVTSPTPPVKKGAIKTDSSNLKLSELDQTKLLKKLSKKGGVNSQAPGSGKKAAKDFSKMKDLPPEERERRMKQRASQIEAAARREKEKLEGGGKTTHKHPLNSERRRANKRKPSDNMKIAIAKKKSKSEKVTSNNRGDNTKKDWNTSGFSIRKGLGGSEGGGNNNVQEGDWRCGKCRENNFARRFECFKCGEKRSGGGGGGRGGGRGGGGRGGRGGGGRGMGRGGGRGMGMGRVGGRGRGYMG